MAVGNQLQQIIQLIADAHGIDQERALKFSSDLLANLSRYAVQPITLVQNVEEAQPDQAEPLDDEPEG